MGPMNRTTFSYKLDISTLDVSTWVFSFHGGTFFPVAWFANSSSRMEQDVSGQWHWAKLVVGVQPTPLGWHHAFMPASSVPDPSRGKLLPMSFGDTTKICLWGFYKTQPIDLKAQYLQCFPPWKTAQDSPTEKGDCSTDGLYSTCIDVSSFRRVEVNPWVPKYPFTHLHCCHPQNLYKEMGHPSLLLFSGEWRNVTWSQLPGTGLRAQFFSETWITVLAVTISSGSGETTSTRRRKQKKGSMKVGEPVYWHQKREVKFPWNEQATSRTSTAINKASVS